MKLMKILQDLQERFGYLPQEELAKLPFPLSEVVGTASFYKFFKFSQEEAQPEIEKLYSCCQPDILLTSPLTYAWTALEKAKVDPEAAFSNLKASGLCGRGGGGFPLATKWETTKNSPAEAKYVVCNADEGEPFTGKDRVILEENPNAVIEGMAICAVIIKAKKAILYLRGEYADLRPQLEAAIEAAPLPCPFEIYMGMGSYVCGEETALLESLEGKRGEPRLKPPFPGIVGLDGMPTVINNVETFACVPFIVENGANAFQAHGTADYTGTKLYTICGCVQKPGVYECEAGITAEELLALAGGATEELQALQIGGGSGSILPADALTVRMDPAGCREYGASLGTGSVRFIGVSEGLQSYVKDLVTFYAAESCGLCVPCRTGLSKLAKLLDTTNVDKVQIEKLAKYVQTNSRCALGQAAVTPVLSWLKGWCRE